MCAGDPYLLWEKGCFNASGVFQKGFSEDMELDYCNLECCKFGRWAWSESMQEPVIRFKSQVTCT